MCARELERVLPGQDDRVPEIVERGSVGARIRHRRCSADQCRRADARRDELLRKRDRPVGEPDRLVRVARHHLVPRRVGHDVRVLVVGLDPSGELERPGHPVRCRGAVAVAPADMREVDRGDRRLGDLVLGHEPVKRALKLVVADVLREAQRLPERPERARVQTIRHPFGGAAKRPNRRGERPDRERTKPGLAERLRGPGLEVGHVDARAPGELDCLDVVVREQLGAVLAPVFGQGLDPARDTDVPVDALRARKLPVDGVPHERVHERVLGRAEHGRPTLSPQELLAPEGAEQRRRRSARPVPRPRAARRTRPRRPSPLRRGAAPSRRAAGDRPGP